MMDPHVKKALNEADWNNLAKCLLRYAAYLTYVGSRSRASELVLDHHDLDDLVYTAIEKVLSGKRQWDPARCSLLQLLKGTIRSDINHLREKLAKSPEVQRTGADDVAESTSDLPLSDAGQEASQPASSSIAELQEEPYTARFRKRLNEAIADDTRLKDLVVAIELGISTPRKVAEFLEMDVSKVGEVYDLKRRFKRLCDRIKQELDDELRGGEQ